MFFILNLILLHQKFTLLLGIATCVATGSGHPGHILCGSTGSDPLYKISGSDPDLA